MIRQVDTKQDKTRQDRTGIFSTEQIRNFLSSPSSLSISTVYHIPFIVYHILFTQDLATLNCTINYTGEEVYLTVEVAPSCCRHTASICASIGFLLPWKGKERGEKVVRRVKVVGE